MFPWGVGLKGVSKLGMPPGEQPLGSGPLPHCLPCCPAPCPQLLARAKSLRASVKLTLHQRRTHTRFGHGQARAAQLSSALLSSLQLLLTDMGAKDNRATLQACCHVQKGEGPIKFTGWDQKCVVCSWDLQKCTVESNEVWCHSLGIVTWKGLAKADACLQPHGDSSYPLCHALEQVTSLLKENEHRHQAGGDGGSGSSRAPGQAAGKDASPLCKDFCACLAGCIGCCSTWPGEGRGKGKAEG